MKSETMYNLASAYFLDPTGQQEKLGFLIIVSTLKDRPLQVGMCYTK
jgi:hypothetical protein